MPPLQTLLLAGVVASAIGCSGAALAQSSNTHLLTVRLPNGGMADIRYSGDVPPEIVFRNAEAGRSLAPVPSLFGPASPFVTLDRISAEMDREAAAMFQRADAVAAEARSGRLTEAAFANLPPGSRSYSFISTMSGNSVCTRSVEITSPGNGAAPHVVSQSSGNCGPGNTATGSVNLPAVPVPAKRPDLLLTSAGASRPYAGMARQIAAADR
jgi:hypothetical protein